MDFTRGCENASKLVAKGKYRGIKKKVCWLSPPPPRGFHEFPNLQVDNYGIDRTSSIHEFQGAAVANTVLR